MAAKLILASNVRMACLQIIVKEVIKNSSIEKNEVSKSTCCHLLHLAIKPNQKLSNDLYRLRESGDSRISDIKMFTASNNFDNTVL